MLILEIYICVIMNLYDCIRLITEQNPCVLFRFLSSKKKLSRFLTRVKRAGATLRKWILRVACSIVYDLQTMSAHTFQDRLFILPDILQFNEAFSLL